MLILGITGGAGTGKSTVVKEIVRKFNVELISLDNLAAQIMNEDIELKNKLREEFSEDGVFDDFGELNRQKMADVVFSSCKKLRRLNELVHPLVFYDMNTLINAIVLAEEGPEATGCEGIIVESALTDASNFPYDMIFIKADREVRIERLSERGYDRERIEKLLNCQDSDAEYEKRCRFTVDNSGKIEDTYREIFDILSREYGLLPNKG